MRLFMNIVLLLIPRILITADQRPHKRVHKIFNKYRERLSLLATIPDYRFGTQDDRMNVTKHDWIKILS